VASSQLPICLQVVLVPHVQSDEVAAGAVGLAEVGTGGDGGATGAGVVSGVVVAVALPKIAA
jgi:hypothetical protein